MVINFALLFLVSLSMQKAGLKKTAKSDASKRRGRPRSLRTGDEVCQAPIGTATTIGRGRGRGCGRGRGKPLGHPATQLSWSSTPSSNEPGQDESTAAGPGGRSSVAANQSTSEGVDLPVLVDERAAAPFNGDTHPFYKEEYAKGKSERVIEVYPDEFRHTYCIPKHQ